MPKALSTIYSSRILSEGKPNLPEGKLGGILTLTQHFNTASYAKNIRWR
jgi:hypothetical protein